MTNERTTLNTLPAVSGGSGDDLFWISIKTGPNVYVDRKISYEDLISALSASGPAGGVLSGTYPNPGFAVTPAYLSFSTIGVVGQSDIVADGPTDKVNFVAGTGMTITTNPTTDEITFESAGSGGGGTPYTVNQTPDNGTYGLLSGLVNGSNAVFTVSDGSYISGTLVVYLNGVLQLQGASDDFQETTPASGTFTFNTAPLIGSIITTTYQTVAANSVAIMVKDEGTTLTNAVGSFDFVGSGVSVTNLGNAVTVSIGAASAGTLTGATLAANVVNSSLTSVGTLVNLTVTNPIVGSITGNAATVTTNANLTGDLTSVGNATTLATVNSDTGSFGSATQAGLFTVSGKGLITAASSATITPAESSITFTDITTNNASTTKHGFVPKLPNDATKYYDGTGNYSVPGGTSAVVTALSGASVVLTVDYTTYASYTFEIFDTNSNSGTAHLKFEVSSDAGVGYASNTIRTKTITNVTITSSSTDGMLLNGSASSNGVATIYQRATGDSSSMVFSGGNPDSNYTADTVQRMGTSAAINRVKISADGSTFGGGYVIAYPNARR